MRSQIVKLLCAGSVPAAFAGTYVMHLMGESATTERELQLLLGADLIAGSAAIIVRSFMPGHHAASTEPVLVRTLVTVAVGVVGGFMVGLTSVGAGSMIMVMLIVRYPHLRNDQLVGTGVVLASGLKYVGVPIETLGILELAIAAVVVVMTVRAKPIEKTHDDFALSGALE